MSLGFEFRITIYVRIFDLALAHVGSLPPILTEESSLVQPPMVRHHSSFAAGYHPVSFLSNSVHNLNKGMSTVGGWVPMPHTNAILLVKNWQTTEGVNVTAVHDGH